MLQGITLIGADPNPAPARGSDRRSCESQVQLRSCLLFGKSRKRLRSVGNGAPSIQAGRLAAMDVRGDEVLLGRPLVMTKANIDQYDF